MKATLLFAGLLGLATLSHAQTAPATTTGSTAPVTGTKNVGSDRADAPQAPSMQSTTPVTKPARSNGSTGSKRIPKQAGFDKPTSAPK